MNSARASYMEGTKSQPKDHCVGPATFRGYLRHTRDSEDGDILIYFAVIALLLMLFAFVYSLQLAIIHAAHVKAQTALDSGVSNGAVILPGSLRPAKLAVESAEAILTNAVGGSVGRFSNSLSGNSSFRISMPQIGLGASKLDVWQSYPLAPDSDHPTGVSLSTEVKEFLFGPGLDGFGGVFDPAVTSGGHQVDDFGNALYMYATFSPFRTMYVSAFTPRVDVASASILKPAFVYLLVDTAFSMDPQMARLVWGVNQFGNIPGTYDVNHTDQLPISGVTYSTAEEWAYPTMPNAFAGQPRDTSLVHEGSTALELPSQATRIHEFYTSLCRTAPFYNAIRANVNLIDALMKSSAFASTTMVGIALEDDIVPIHPVEIVSGVARHPTAPDDFYPSPMQTAAAGQEYLHSTKTEAFHGWLNTETASEPAVASAEMPASGRNLPELAFCRAVASGNSSADFYPVDNYAVTNDVAALTYAADDRRRRAGIDNWMTDDLAAKFHINLAQAQNGSGSDPARNLLAAQGMRITNNNFYGLMQSGVKWQRPDLNSIGSALRSMGPSMEKATDALRAGRAAYTQATVNSEENPYARLRPIDKSDVYLVVTSFGPYSQATFDATKAANPLLTDEQVHALLKENFLKSLAYALCGRKDAGDPVKDAVSVILSFTPYTPFDRLVVANLSDDLREFGRYYDAQLTGGATPGSIAACEGTNVASFTYLFVDYESMTFDAGTADQEHKRKVLRASYYHLNIFVNQVVLPKLRRYMFAY